MMYSGTKGGNRGWIGTPRGRPYLPGWWNILCASNVWCEGMAYYVEDGSRLPEMEGKGVLQNLIPHVGKLEFPQVPFEGWVIDIDEHGLFYGPGDAECFPA